MRGRLASVYSSIRVRLDTAARNVLLVCLIAGVALAISIPNYILCFADPYGDFGFSTDDNHRVTVVVAGGSWHLNRSLHNPLPPITCRSTTRAAQPEAARLVKEV